MRLTNFAGLVLALSALCASVANAQNANRDMLDAHSDEFKKEVIKVTDGVYVAVGFGLANSILIEGDEGVIIVDTMESQRAAQEVKAEFDKITNKPVKAIIYTHNHYDHVYGAKVFAGKDKPAVFAHELLSTLVDTRRNVVQPAIFARSTRQFGVTLPAKGYLNAGIGPRLNIGGAAGAANFIAPTITFGDEPLETEVAGIKIKLVHAPGETDDQLFVWLPDKRVLLPGDNFYKAFPNLYAIRGTPYRDVRKWADSLDLMLAEKPKFLVPSHTRPVIGEDTIRETLTHYRDAIRTVLDQTLKGLNRGLGPDALVEVVKLPDNLANQPYLHEYYGTIAWSVRAIFAGYLGWFDGNATTLFPLSPKDRAQRMVEMAGGKENLLKKAQAAHDASDHQWSLELIDHLLTLDPRNAQARTLKGEALLALGEQQISANARNYFITSAVQAGVRLPK